MTAPDDTRLQANFMLPNGDLINVYAKDALDLKARLEDIELNAGAIATVGNLLRGAATVANAGLTGAPAQQPQASNGFSDGQQQAVQQYQQSAAQAAPQYQQPPAAPAPVCKHGPMTYRSGTGKRGAWTAHFCPAPKGDPSQCEPIWGN